MEKEKKVAVKTTKKEAAKKAPATKAPAKAPAKVKKVEEVKPIEVKQPVVEEKAPQPVKAEKKSFTLNQDLNLLIGLFAIMTIVAFCLAFKGGEAELTGWELFVTADSFSGVFKGLMVVYVISLFVDCLLAIRVESENEVFNIIEKVLYMFTLVANVIIATVLLNLIKDFGLGLIIFLILSIVSVLVKLARIYAQNK